MLLLPDSQFTANLCLQSIHIHCFFSWNIQLLTHSAIHKRCTDFRNYTYCTFHWSADPGFKSWLGQATSSPENTLVRDQDKSKIFTMEKRKMMERSYLVNRSIEGCHDTFKRSMGKNYNKMPLRSFETFKQRFVALATRLIRSRGFFQDSSMHGNDITWTDPNSIHSNRVNIWYNILYITVEKSSSYSSNVLRSSKSKLWVHLSVSLLLNILFWMFS